MKIIKIIEKGRTKQGHKGPKGYKGHKGRKGYKGHKGPKVTMLIRTGKGMQLKESVVKMMMVKR